jgi:hypothetical protein
MRTEANHRGGRRPRRRHPAARSRLVAGVLGAAVFLGLGGGIAAHQAVAAAAATTATGSGGSSASSWGATAGTATAGQAAVTSSQGS